MFVACGWPQPGPGGYLTKILERDTSSVCHARGLLQALCPLASPLPTLAPWAHFQGGRCLLNPCGMAGGSTRQRLVCSEDIHPQPTGVKTGAGEAAPLHQGRTPLSFYVPPGISPSAGQLCVRLACTGGIPWCSDVGEQGSCRKACQLVLALSSFLASKAGGYYSYSRNCL